MASIDYKDFDYSSKNVTFCLTVYIFIANSLLIFKTARKRDFLYRPRSFLVISLAIGDIILAFKTFRMKARILFDTSMGKSGCSSAETSAMYTNYLVHFVYGMGLIALAMELLGRYERRPLVGSTAVVKGIVLSAVPWVLGLAVVLPFTVTETNQCPKFLLTTCVDCGVQDFYSVSVLLPACVAVIVSVEMHMKSAPVQQAYQDVTFHRATRGKAVAANRISDAHRYNPLSYIHASAKSKNTAQPHVPLQEHEAKSDVIKSAPATYKNKPQSTTCLVMVSPSQQITLQRNSVQSKIASTPGTYQEQAQNRTVQALSDLYREKNVLLIISFVYFVCVSPGIVPYLTRILNLRVDDLVYVSVSYLLSVLRPLITPVIWMRC